MSKTLRSTLMENSWFSQNLRFSIEPYQIPRIWPQIWAPRHRTPFGQPLWKIHGFSQNLWFSIGTKNLTSDSSSSMSKTVRSTLMDNRCFFDPADTQASRQFFFYDSSLREREQVTLVWELAQLFLVGVLSLHITNHWFTQFENVV